MSRNRRPLSYERQKRYIGWVYVLPWLIGLVYFFLIPLGFSLINSFADLSIEPGEMNFAFVGFKHYHSALFTDSNTLPNLFGSIGNLLYQVPILLMFSMFVAVILNQKFPGRLFLRGVFFLPLITTSSVVMQIISGDSMAQSMMGGTTESALFQVTSIRDWMMNSTLPYEVTNFIFNFINSIFDLVWKSGIQILLLLAGLQTISGSLYEAASIEGATAWETFWKITIPMLSPILLLVSVYSIIDSFTDVSSNMVMARITALANNFNYGVSAALSWLYFLLVGVVLLAVLLLARRAVSD
ncbi:MAG: sugar ABC transporter permease [Clostridia bacterium]|nr:sugar ABC transporter permease [Clostridia bacterium]